MRVRLGFAVAAHLDPDILMIDEVLAVGDVAFQEKCLKKMNSLTQLEERTVLFVSHSMGAIANMCSSALLLDGGRLAYKGATGEVVDRYFRANRTDEGIVSVSERRDRSGTGAMRFTGFYLQEPGGRKVTCAQTGEAIELVFEYEAVRDFVGQCDTHVTAVVSGSRGVRLFGLPSDMTTSLAAVLGRSGRFICRLPKLPLRPGNYELDVSLFVNKEMTDKLMRAASITVVDGDFYGSGRLPGQHFGDMLVPFAWRLEPTEIASRQVHA
jgi:lipopolysaccharide transport system ATP-binding protein